MEEKQIKALVKETARETAKETVKETFVTLGIDACDPLEAQKDFQFLHSTRVATDKVKSKGLLVAVGAVVVAVVGFIIAKVTSCF